jgi:hypothetical protein
VAVRLGGVTCFTDVRDGFESGSESSAKCSETGRRMSFKPAI